MITETPSDTTTTPRTTYRFYYNDDGKVQHIYAYVPASPASSYYYYYQTQSHYIYFAYNGNIIQARTVYGQQTIPSNIDTVILDAQSRITQIDHNGYYGSYDPQWDSYQYTDSGTVWLHNSNNYGNFFTDTLLWQGGDLVKDTRIVEGSYDPTDIYNYTYFDTLYNTGNISAMPAELEKYGRSVFTSKHLVKQIFDSRTDSTWTYNYILDTGGKITEITTSVAGNISNKTQIAYLCE